MRNRILILLVVATAVGLLAAGPASAGTIRHFVPGPGYAAAHPAAPGLAAARAQVGILPRPVAAMLAAAGTAQIDGSVYSRFGDGLYKPEVDWWVETSPDVWDGGFTNGDSFGHYGISSADVATGNGELDVYYGNSIQYQRTGLSWADPGPTTIDFPAAGVSVSALREPVSQNGWGDWTSFYLDVVGSDGLGQTWSDSRMVTTNATTNPGTGAATVLAGSTPSAAAVYFWINEGVEVAPPAAKAPTESPSPFAEVTADESVAQRTGIAVPFWNSGKPGITASVVFNRFPAGWQVALDGSDDYGPVTRQYGTLTLPSSADHVVRLRVPSSAKPGYIWWFGEQHTGGPLYLQAGYQVCTLKSTRSIVTKGQSVILRGVVPIANHIGSQKGRPTTVIIWAHAGTASVPHVWNPQSKGWSKLKSVRTNGYGAYHTPKLYPSRTMTLVARYPGDKWYWGAYTSTIKITAKK